MRKPLVLAVFFLLFASLSAQNKLIKGEKDYYLSNTIVIKLKEAPSAVSGGSVTLPSSVSKVLAAYKVSSAVQKFPSQGVTLYKSGQELSKIVTVTYSSGEDPLYLSKKIAKTSGIEWAEPRYARHVTYDVNDPASDSLTQYALYKIKAKQAWDITRGDSTIIIAIIDTGVFWDHPDLEANIYQNLNEDADNDGHTIEWDGSAWILDPGDLNGIDDDGNGYADDLIGWDFGGSDGTADGNPVEDPATHGTLVAGTASAVTNNGIGIASIGFNCSLMPVKCTRKDLGSDYIIYVAEGIKYAADNGAKIINCSFSGYGYSQAEKEAIDYAIAKGALVVAAAGNEYTDAPEYPAAYDGVMSVAATNSSDKMWSASNYGATIDVSAPGQQIYTTWLSSSYSIVSGTSLSTPLVSGLAGLVKSRFPNYTPLQIAEQIRVTTDDISGNLADSLKYRAGSGRINAYKALTTTGAISVRAVNISFNDEGNNNGIIQSGEMASIRMTFLNYLSAVSGLRVSLSTESPYISIQNSSFSAGSIASLDSVKNNYNKFYFTVNDNAPANQTVSFLLTYTANSYTDYQWISVIVNRTYGILNVNNLSLTITSAGNLGYDDFPDNSLGAGLQYLGSNNLLYEGAFMYGRSSSLLVDAAHANSTTQNKEFYTITPFTKQSSSLYADAAASAVFNDDNASSNKLGIETKLISYAYTSSSYNNFIILRAALTNKSGADINNLYAGWYLDLDLDETDYEDNIAVYDSINKFIYAYNSDISTFQYYVGAALLSNQNLGVYAIDNLSSNNGINMPVSFTKAAKWKTLSSGIGSVSAGPSDISIVVSSGPFNIKADSCENVAFVIAAGESPDDLKTIIENSRIKYSTIPDDNGTETAASPGSYYLSQNFPNPFVAFTKIRYDLPQADYVKIKIFDSIGRELAVLTNGYIEAGEHFVLFNGNLYPSGVYIYQIETSSFRQAKKMALVK